MVVEQKGTKFPEIPANVLTLLGISASTYAVSKGIQAGSKPDPNAPPPPPPPQVRGPGILMAARSSKTKVAPAALGAAGAIPLALALTVGNLTPGGGGSTGVNGDPNASVKCEDGIENFRGCHPTYQTGCSGSGKYDGYLIFSKNQEPARSSTPVKLLTSAAINQDLNSRTPTDLRTSNHFDLKDDLAKLVSARNTVSLDICTT